MIRRTVQSSAGSDLLGTVTGAVPVVLFELDPDGVVLQSEGAGHRALGRPEGGSVGRSIFEVYADVPPVLDAVRRALAGEEFVSVVRVPGASGEVTFQTTYIPVRSDEGDVERVVGVALDVTERDRYAQRLRALAAQTLRQSERERTRIAHDAHDVLGQVLTAVRFDVAWLQRRLGGDKPLDPDALRARLSELDDRTATAVRAVRDLAVGLRPPGLDTRGLAAAVQTAARRFEGRTDIRTTVCADLPADVESALGTDPATALFRILQESLTNVVRHADADHVSVDLGVSANGGHVTLSVEDDGRGFDPGSVRPGALGIAGMTERAAWWGGTVDVSTCPDGGTCVDVAFPVEPTAEGAGADGQSRAAA